jgi:hypothetical protein
MIPALYALLNPLLGLFSCWCLILFVHCF